MMEPILLTSAGGLVGTYIAKRFRRAGGPRVIAADLNESNTARLFADAFYVVPPVSSGEYLPALNAICEKEGVRRILPVSSLDVDAFCLPEAKAALPGRRWLTMDQADHLRLHDKKSANAYLASLGIGVPRLLDAPEYPCVFKPTRGTGTKNTFVLQEEADYRYWSKKVPEHLLTEYLEGDEFTVDCLFDPSGRCLGANPRKRVKMNGGGAVISQNAYTEDVSGVIDALERTGVVKGPVNFQYKRGRDGEICVFDFNTRLPSGGLALTVESGFDIPARLMALLDGETMEKWTPDPQMDGLTMLRYYDEGFVDAEGRVLFQRTARHLE